MRTSLDHEKLEVYQASLEFITWTIPLLDGLPGAASVRNQLDRASTSIPLNIAEANGKFTSPDRCRSSITPAVLHWSRRHVSM
jgi:four helix bundle protein